MRVIKTFSSIVFCIVAVFAFAEAAFSQEVMPSATAVVPRAVSSKEPVSNSSSPSDVKAEAKMKVVFDEDTPGVVYVEANGERIRVDTSKKSVESVATMIPDKNTELRNTALAITPKVPAAKADDDESPYDFDKGEEPYDYRVVNVPTAKNVPKGSYNLIFTHRFTQQLRPFSSSARSLLGLDSFAIASFGLTYGITDKLYVSAYRSPVCRKGFCRVIEVGVGYNWLAQDKKSPIGLTTFASIEGGDNFTEEYTYNLQAMLSARVGKRVFLHFSPAVHLNSNGQRKFDPRPTDYFPAATIANNFRMPKHGASFGFGASVAITPNVMALFDFTPRTGFKMGSVRTVLGPGFSIVGFTNESHPSIGFGVQRNIGKHSFALTLSNTQTTTTSRYNSSNLTLSPKELILGFNLSRRF
ncbi:MAG: DUF5777 family beta-barrel protein [Pyrinomonadaceae bacterium]